MRTLFTRRPGWLRGLPPLAMALGLAACAPAPPDVTTVPFVAGKAHLLAPVRLVLASDTHDDLPLLARFTRAANGERAALVLVTGDLQQFGTPTEWAAVDAGWKALRAPLAVAPGNHDHRKESLAHLRAVYGPVPRSLDVGGLHVVLLDDGLYRFGPQLDFLERDLAAHRGARTLVAMHVPLQIPDRMAWMRVADRLPSIRRRTRRHVEDHYAVPDPYGARLAAILARYRVDALVCGHLHAYGLSTGTGGVPCIHLGTVGGYLPVLGEPHSYLVATATDAGLRLERKALDAPPPDPIALVRSWRSYRRMARGLAHDPRAE